MSDQPIRKAPARVMERERARKQAEPRDTLLRALPAGIAVVAMLFIGIVIFAALNQTPPGTVDARLQVDQEKIDLGNRVFNQPVRASFTVKNVGNSVLKLDAPQIASVLEGC